MSVLLFNLYRSIVEPFFYESLVSWSTQIQDKLLITKNIFYTDIKKYRPQKGSLRRLQRFRPITFTVDKLYLIFLTYLHK